MTWYEVYLKDISKKKNLTNYVIDKIKNKKVLINLIKKYSANQNIVEAGSGTGVISTYMASLGFKVTSFDIDDQILKLSKKIANEYPSKNKPKFVKQSIFELKLKKDMYDVSFSNGVLEHFTDEQIIKTLKDQMYISNYVIFGIPTKYFNQEEAMYGDERYLDFDYWRNLIEKADGIILEEKSMHYMDYLHRIFNFKKYFRPYPFHIFVCKRK